MPYPIFFQPVFQERIWGGTRLRENFFYQIPSDHTGECWGISAHPHGKSIVKNGDYAGYELDTLWRKQRHLFGDRKEDAFPLLIKILDANEDLSIQVHPDDHYAQLHEQQLSGKTECWYIIDCEEGAEVIYGHHAKSREEFKQKYLNQEWDTLFRRIKIKPGDFFYVPSGTLHALGKGTLVLETQQNSDLTYRVYDYDRVDANGKKRELHLDKALEVTHFPHRDFESKPTNHIDQSTTITRYIENQFFCVQKWQTTGTSKFVQDKSFMLISVIDGKGEIEANKEIYPFLKGDHLLLPWGMRDFKISGDTEWMVSYLMN